jgi:hypothetical protein
MHRLSTQDNGQEAVMTASRSRVGRTVAAGLLTVPLALGLAAGAEAKPNRSGSSGTTSAAVATILDVQCDAGKASGLTYQVTSTSSTVDVEVRWQVWTGQILSFGSTYAVYSYRGVPTNTELTAPAPSTYTVTSVTVMPMGKNGRTGGTADSEAVTCPTG